MQRRPERKTAPANAPAPVHAHHGDRDPAQTEMQRLLAVLTLRELRAMHQSELDQKIGRLLTAIERMMHLLESVLGEQTPEEDREAGEISWCLSAPFPETTPD